MTIPLAPILGLMAPLGPAINSLMAGDINAALINAKWHLLGINAAGEFSGAQLIKGVTPIVAGLLIHKFVGGPPLNLNAMLGRAKVPFIRI